VPEALRDERKLPGTTQHLMPIATLRKQPLRNFDLRDEVGRSVPVLGREHNGLFAWATLLSASWQARAEAALASQTVDRLRLISNAPAAEARSALKLLDADAAEDPELESLLADDTMRLLLGELAEN